MTDRFEGKVALVTGAASGIGKAAALQWASEGAAVAVADLDGVGARATAAVIAGRGGRAEAVDVDVADAGAVSAMVAHVVDTFGALHYAFNNAGIVGAGAPIAEMPEIVWERGIGVVLTGVFLCMKYEIQAMLAGDGGAIVNTSSGAGVIGFPGMADYVAAKHGVIGLTKTAALEVIGSGIRVNAICPGTARSRMVEEWMAGDDEAEAQVSALHPIGRIAGPEEIAAAALWLCSDEASFVVGHAMVVDGGYTIR